MNKTKFYKECLDRHEDPRYTFEHYEGFSFYPRYNMDNNDLRDLKKFQKELLNSKGGYRISDRAIVVNNGHGYDLISYYTTVCSIYNGTFYKLWEGFSNTTMKHINVFLANNMLSTMSKKDWVMFPTTTNY